MFVSKLKNKSASGGLDILRATGTGNYAEMELDAKEFVEEARTAEPTDKFDKLVCFDGALAARLLRNITCAGSEEDKAAAVEAAAAR